MPATITLADRIWSAWRRAVQTEGAEWRLQLLLVPSGDVAGAERAVGVALQELASAPAAVDEPFAGEWSWFALGTGIVITVTECDRFDDVLPQIARAIARSGVSGTLDLHRVAPSAAPPPYAELLTCRVRVRGTRVRLAAGRYAWEPDRAALRRVLSQADQLVRDDPGHGTATCLLDAGGAGWLAIGAEQDIVDQVLGKSRLGLSVTVTAHAGGAFRSLQVSPYGGLAVVLGLGGDGQDGLPWTEAATILTDLLRSAAGDVVYGALRRGWDAGSALVDGMLGDDWPVREPHRPVAPGLTPYAFDDLLAPDAFGVQLLGAGYADRLPAGPWQLERLPGEATLAGHPDPAAWFSEPFVAFRDFRPAANRPVPAVLDHARQQLAPLLYRPGMLAGRGFTDLTDV